MSDEPSGPPAGLPPLREPPSAERLLDSLASAGIIHGPISPEKQDVLHRIVEDFMEEVARGPGRDAGTTVRRVSRTRKIFTAFLVTAALFVWLVRPTARDDEPSPTPVVIQEASLRFAMFLRRARVEEYRNVYGRLPARMEPEDGIHYIRRSLTQYDLYGQNGRVKLRLRSTDPPATFLGASLETLMRRRRPLR